MWRSTNLLFTFLLAGCVLSLVALGVYFIGPLNNVSAAGAFCLLVAFALWYGNPFRQKIVWREPGSLMPWHAISIWALAETVIFSLLLVARTSEPLVSPWLLLPSTIFLLFFLSTVLTVYLGVTLGKRSLPFAIAHVFLAVSVSALVYGIGFGFDPFIHRAAETALVTEGSISPVSLLYSGQYAVIGLLHFLTWLPVRVLDIWLLPFLASVLLPLAAYVGLRHGWGLREETASLGWLAMLFIPFMLFTFTVPFSVTYLLFALMLCLFPLARDLRWWFLLSLIGVVSVFFHPLLGVPIFLLAFFSGLVARLNGRRTALVWGFVFVAAMIIAVPALLVIYQHQAGSAVLFSGLWHNMFGFLSLFANPFNNYHPSIFWPYHLLYAVRYWQPVILTLLAYPLAFLLAKKHRSNVTVLALFALGLLGCTYVISTLFVFKGIISHEQQEFALRLLQSFYIIPIPLLMLWVEGVIEHPRDRWLLLACISILITTSWYFSYPQFNAKFAYYSPSVSTYDVQAVRAIEADSAGRPYLVLSNQMTSAAALQEFGFAHYYTFNGQDILWYPIPTGGDLYTYYLQTISGVSDNLAGLMTATDTEYIYVVMNSYWVWNDDVVTHFEVQSHKIIRIEDKITLYRFDRYEVSHDNPDPDLN